MRLNVAREEADLNRLPVTRLRERYAEVFGEATRANNRTWLVKRILWRLQAQAEGGLTERAERRAAELANDADLRVVPPREKPDPDPVPERTVVEPIPQRGDDRLPPPGTVLTRPYKGETLRVTVLAEGFEFEGRVYGSLSAVAKAITGSHCNGFLFFKLPAPGGDR